MNRWDKEVLASWLRDEKTALKAVEGHYTAALAEIKKKIILMEGQDGEMAQSQIYQLQYQKSLQAQISAILEKLHSDEYQTIQAFLEGCYTSGFLGTMYSVAGQGIPLLLPMDPAAVVRAVITDSKLSKDLYDALGVDINQLKRVIRSEISRGIAANLPIDEISRNISLRTGTPLAHAKTIARTESHRIQEAATEDARQAVKKRGCNVIKQWDSTLDGDTRPTHQRLDGQIRETDEPFEMDGKKAMFPGDFGDPAEDCNCRCHALTRAKAAMTERELETLRERAAFFGLDKSKNFGEFREKYLKTVAKIGKDGIIKLDNVAVRAWYLERVSKIIAGIDRNLPIEEQARQAFEARNQLRTEAREMMADESTRAKLDKERPNKTFEELIESKMKRKGMTREEAIRDILETATKTNEDVNKELGLGGD